MKAKQRNKALVEFGGVRSLVEVNEALIAMEERVNFLMETVIDLINAAPALPRAKALERLSVYNTLVPPPTQESDLEKLRRSLKR